MSSLDVPAVIARLQRLNNLLIFLVVLVGLACVAAVQTRHLYREPPAFLSLLTWLRAGAIAAALVLTMLFTQWAMHRQVRRNGERPVEPQDAVPAFRFSKTLSMVLLALAGCFAAAGLLFGHRAVDVLLALVPLLLLFLTRPTVGGLHGFAQMLETARAQLYPPSETIEPQRREGHKED